ncbi:hypothetical protein BGZ80_011271 [Entomortierella chlamydospora]|uniref:Uncharacterized protein n=1 Tax=Entomortierella chlamydospora TaxID=101097 RepID=A0A9P6SZ46_9FUNG|nr:hypothetical protein BGZ80_011271 [Entomortierella chlamydospora]
MKAGSMLRYGGLGAKHVSPQFPPGDNPDEMEDEIIEKSGEKPDDVDVDPRLIGGGEVGLLPEIGDVEEEVLFVASLSEGMELSARALELFWPVKLTTVVAAELLEEEAIV